jgi:amino acid transporter
VTEVDIPASAPSTYTPPAPVSPASGIPLPPDSLAYRLKRRLLGNPLHSEELEHQRLGKPTALAVFASDNLSSSAYATEEILHVLIPLIGIAAFSLVVPITVAMCVVLGFLILSYRETIKEYPSAGGAYLVTRDNFGIVPAQVAGASLLTDYILTVAVSASAGTAALVSAFDALAPYKVPIAIFFIALIAYGNLRGVKESGRVFAIPTYFFIAGMTLLLGIGAWKALRGELPYVGEELPGHVEWGHQKADALFYGAGLYGVLHAFASGGAAVTGVEAISNGVPAFRRPEWKNARQTLVVMGAGLGVMFLGLSWLASEIKVAPFEEGTPTVISQVGEAVFGSSTIGHVLYYGLQAGTMLILIMAANTGFADFPRLASFQAGDRFLPRQLTRRGHRLVYSNGIMLLAGVAMVLVVATGAEVTNLIPLYAIGVFTGFTLSQSGMTRHHVRLRESGWRKGLVINGLGAGVSLVVTLIIAITKFRDGAWAILITLPVMVVVLLRLNRQYQREGEILEEDLPAAAAAPILRRHVVLVFVDKLDLASARAVQYARTLTPDELRAVHFVIDEQHAERLQQDWQRLGMSRAKLELVACPDRRLTRTAVETVARELADGDTEVSVLLPDRKYRGFWHRILHDKTADSILEEVSRLPHANVTTVPFHLDRLDDPGARLVKSPVWISRRARRERRDDSAMRPVATVHVRDDGTTPIGSVRWRDNVAVAGQVRSMRIAPALDAPTLEIVLADDTGELSIVFLGRRHLAGVVVGSRIRAEGTVGVHRNRLALLNPPYRILT